MLFLQVSIGVLQGLIFLLKKRQIPIKLPYLYLTFLLSLSHNILKVDALFLEIFDLAV